MEGNFMFNFDQGSAPSEVRDVTFEINYKTNYGEIVCVVGNIPELGKSKSSLKFSLGSWKEFKCRLKWH